MGAVCSGSTLFASILNLSVMLGYYLQDFSRRHFQMNFFLGALRVKSPSIHGSRGRHGFRTPPLKNHKVIGVLCNTGPDPLKNHKATKPTSDIGLSWTRQRLLTGR